MECALCNNSSAEPGQETHLFSLSLSLSSPSSPPHLHLALQLPCLPVPLTVHPLAQNQHRDWKQEIHNDSQEWNDIAPYHTLILQSEVPLLWVQQLWACRHDHPAIQPSTKSHPVKWQLDKITASYHQLTVASSLSSGMSWWCLGPCPALHNSTAYRKCAEYDDEVTTE